ncbi:hypothetical protein HUT19_22735 [Streptomyces sp. NA02950]|uniref:hypothetical protein n=1 Tax=Streptomyces sp. NA02950 TaxID=2742137 RepID=UPI0015920827|nr:hypothetical protein [Streptomyces sp. NA02950]QKV94227.1 hypothetical protein HUT19_22735 [Streptomyces sp. NA02950]
MDEDDQAPAAEQDWHRPRAARVPMGPARVDGQQEFAEGDPIDVQDWDYRLWRRT